MPGIALLDCNNFFVSCERLFRPDLEGKPVAVLSSNDGCIVARSQEVKDLGVPMGIPLFQAKQLYDLAEVTFFSSNFPLYRDISRRVMDILASEVGKIEVYSIDESFFTLPQHTTEAELLELRRQVMRRSGIPVSIGFAPSKTLAKVASKLGKKQGGVRRLTLPDWEQLAASFNLEDIWNLGGATARRLRALEVHTPAAFMELAPQVVEAHFGVVGRRLQDELRGTAVYRVGENSDALRQSLASTRSFAGTTNDRGALMSALGYHLTHVAEKLREKELAATTVIVELRPSRHGDFAYRRGSWLVPLALPAYDTTTLLRAVEEGFEQLYEAGVPYKKAGVVLSGLVPQGYVQPDLFSAAQPNAGVDTVTDSLNRRFGPGTIRPALVLDNRPKVSANLRSPRYTTTWNDIPTVKAKEAF